MKKIENQEEIATIEQIRLLANKLGWVEEFDLQGQFILYSGIT